jgi:hypothetical protein
MGKSWEGSAAYRYVVETCTGGATSARRVLRWSSAWIASVESECVARSRREYLLASSLTPLDVGSSLSMIAVSLGISEKVGPAGVLQDQIRAWSVTPCGAHFRPKGEIPYPPHPISQLPCPCTGTPRSGSPATWIAVWSTCPEPIARSVSQRYTLCRVSPSDANSYPYAMCWMIRINDQSRGIPRVHAKHTHWSYFEGCLTIILHVD